VIKYQFVDFEDIKLSTNEIINVGDATFNKFIHVMIAAQKIKLSNALTVTDSIYPKEMSSLIARRQSAPTSQSRQHDHFPSAFCYTQIPPLLSTPLSNFIFTGYIHSSDKIMIAMIIIIMMIIMIILRRMWEIG
jgi:hypothetical protein